MSTYSRRLPKLNHSLIPKDRNEFVDESPKPSSTSFSSADTCCNNRLLAGYLAHEFLNRATLFGQKWDPAAAAAASVSEFKSKKRSRAEPGVNCYDEVANILKSEETQIPRIVNPSQLVRWLQM